MIVAGALAVGGLPAKLCPVPRQGGCVMGRYAKLHLVPKLNIAVFCAALVFVSAIVVGAI